MKSNIKHKHRYIILYKNKIIFSDYNYYKITNKIYSNNNNTYIHDKYSIYAEKMTQYKKLKIYILIININ